MEIYEPLVDTHFEAVPCVRTFAIGCFPRRDSQSFSRQPYGSTYVQVLFLRTSDEILGNFELTTSRGALNVVERYGNPETWEIFYFRTGGPP